MTKKIQSFLLLILIFTCIIRRFADVNFYSDLIDELLVVLIFVYSCMIGGINKNRAIATIAFTMIGCMTFFVSIGLLMGSLMNNHTGAIVQDTIDLLKFPTLFLFIVSLRITDRQYRFIERAYIFIAFPSMLMGIIQWYLAKFMGIYLATSEYSIRGGNVRITGFSNYYIDFGFTMLLVVAFLVERKHRSVFDYITLIMAFLCAYFTGSRLPILCVFLYLGCKVWSLRNKWIRLSSIFVVSVVAFLVFVNIFTESDNKNNSGSNLEDEVDGTIRMVNVITSMKVLEDYPLFGTGLGSFGVSQAAQNRSYVYTHYNYPTWFRSMQAEGSVREAFLFHVLIAGGTLGLFLYLAMYFRLLHFAYAHKEYLSVLALALCILLNGIINSFYQLSVYYMVAIMYARMLTRESEKSYKNIKRINNNFHSL